jgi:hypothetical protein
MSNEPERGVIASLPHSRPHRRSDKRQAPPAPAPPPETTKPPAPAPEATKPPEPAPPPEATKPPEPSRREVPGPLETAVQAAAELAEIGLHAGARALRGAVSRLPRP